MDVFLPLTLFCGWHLLVFGAGVAVGHLRPWRWRIVRPDESAPMGHSTNTRQPYPEENEVFARIK